MIPVTAVCREQGGEVLYDVRLADRLEIGMSEERAVALIGSLGQAVADIFEVYAEAQPDNEALAGMLQVARRAAALTSAAALMQPYEARDDAGAIALGSARDDAVLLWLGGSGPMRLGVDTALRAMMAIRHALAS